jgi:membrane-associated phospholipid phosphatase
LFADRAGLLRYGISVGLLCVLGLALFALWPTRVPADLVDWQAHGGMALLQGMDLAGNACPSMHVASAVFSGIWTQRLLGELQVPFWPRGLDALWCLAIVYSTMAVKQHVFIDVLCGLLLGAVIAILSLRWHASRAPLPVPEAAPNQPG